MGCRAARHAKRIFGGAAKSNSFLIHSGSLEPPYLARMPCVRGGQKIGSAFACPAPNYDAVAVSPVRSLIPSVANVRFRYCSLSNTSRTSVLSPPGPKQG